MLVLCLAWMPACCLNMRLSSSFMHYASLVLLIYIIATQYYCNVSCRMIDGIKTTIVHTTRSLHPWLSSSLAAAGARCAMLLSSIRYDILPWLWSSLDIGLIVNPTFVSWQTPLHMESFFVHHFILIISLIEIAIVWQCFVKWQCNELFVGIRLQFVCSVNLRLVHYRKKHSAQFQQKFAVTFAVRWAKE